MKKLTLGLDALEVATFHPAPAEDDGPDRGTVRAHAAGPTNGNTCRTCQTYCLPYC